MTRQQEIQSDIERQLALPAPDAASQLINDQLALFDRLIKDEQHSTLCILGQAFGGKQCQCGEG